MSMMRPAHRRPVGIEKELLPLFRLREPELLAEALTRRKRPARRTAHPDPNGRQAARASRRVCAPPRQGMCTTARGPSRQSASQRASEKSPRAGKLRIPSRGTAHTLAGPPAKRESRHSRLSLLSNVPVVGEHSAACSVLQALARRQHGYITTPSRRMDSKKGPLSTSPDSKASTDLPVSSARRSPNESTSRVLLPSP